MTYTLGEAKIIYENSKERFPLYRKGEDHIEEAALEAFFWTNMFVFTFYSSLATYVIAKLRL